MKINDILTDFCIYLMLEQEVTYPELTFFYTKIELSEETYKNYVNSMKKFICVDCFRDNNEIQEVTKLNSLEDILTDDEIYQLSEYIESDFSFGYPCDYEDGFPVLDQYHLSLDKNEIICSFNDYLKLRKYNTNVYITYYLQFFAGGLGIREEVSSIEKEIDNFYIAKEFISEIEFSKSLDTYKKDIETKLAESLKKSSFKIFGDFDEKGFIFNKDKSLAYLLKLNITDLSKLEKDFSIVRSKCFEFKTNSRLDIPIDSEKTKALRKEFKNIKSKNKSQIKYLKDKKFLESEIDIILNCFCLNKFKDIGIRSLNNPKKIDFFQLFYFFYRFDFLIDEKRLSFEKEIDFLKLPLSGEIDKNQYLKYYKERNNKNDLTYTYLSNNKNYPFKKVKRFIERIESDLLINKEKIKSI